MLRDWKIGNGLSNALANLAPMNRNFLGSLDPKPQHVAFDRHNPDRNASINDDGFAVLSRKN
jgi:hypothetical protein